MGLERFENMKTVNRVLTAICSMEDDTVDGWRYFLASGLAYGFLEAKPEIRNFTVANMQDILNAEWNDHVKFEQDEIVQTAKLVWHAFCAVEMHCDDLEKALVDNAIERAEIYQTETNVPVDTCWTCFSLGVQNRDAFLTEGIIPDDDEHENFLKPRC